MMWVLWRIPYSSIDKKAFKTVCCPVGPCYDFRKNICLIAIIKRFPTPFLTYTLKYPAPQAENHEAFAADAPSVNRRKRFKLASASMCIRLSCGQSWRLSTIDSCADVEEETKYKPFRFLFNEDYLTSYKYFCGSKVHPGMVMDSQGILCVFLYGSLQLNTTIVNLGFSQFRLHQQLYLWCVS